TRPPDCGGSPRREVGRGSWRSSRSTTTRWSSSGSRTAAPPRAPQTGSAARSRRCTTRAPRGGGPRPSAGRAGASSAPARRRGARPRECCRGRAWGVFCAAQRVRPFVRIAVGLGVLGGADLDVVGRACDRVASGELDDPAETPSRLHGDLWTGNVLWAPAGDGAGGGASEAVLIDPAAHGGHRETDLAMLALFGAPHLDRILAAYDEARPLTAGWRDRVPLHQLHPLATHSAGHGAGYAVALADAARAVLRL